MMKETANEIREASPIVRQIDAFDAVCDVLVVGSGGAGYAAAISAARHGSAVIQLEKADDVGGTTRKSAGAIWICNNSFLRRIGRTDERRQALRYMARLSEPALYDPASETFGLPHWQFALLETFYDRGAEAMDQLSQWGAVRLTTIREEPDYYSELLEEPNPTGRVVFPRADDDSPEGRGNGVDLIRGLDLAARRSGVEVRTGCRVRSAMVNGEGAVFGVVVEGRQGHVRLGARQGVIFASGGFAHNGDLCRNFLGGPTLGSCAALSNTGDFLPIAQMLGADLANMSRAWLTPMLLEEAIVRDPTVNGFFVPPGDSMLMVNRRGYRVLNEKAPYNEQGKIAQVWDPYRAEFPNLMLVMVWDIAAKQHYVGGRIRTTVMTDKAHPGVVSASTLEGLSTAVANRLESLAGQTGGARLEASFAEALRGTVARFNRFAETGVDEDFHRGESPIERYFHGPARPGNDRNPTMWPLGAGPFFATLVAPGMLDTKGGPKLDQHGQVLDHKGRAVPRLFAAGNCAASPSGLAYWGAGGTLGLALTFGFVAGMTAARQPRRAQVLARA